MGRRREGRFGTGALVHPGDFESPVGVEDAEPGVGVDEDEVVVEFGVGPGMETRVPGVLDGAVALGESPARERTPTSPVSVAIVELLAGRPRVGLGKEGGDEADDVLEGIARAVRSAGPGKHGGPQVRIESRKSSRRRDSKWERRKSERDWVWSKTWSV